MPLTPFVGLSVLIHLLIIWGHWFVDFVTAPFRSNKQKPAVPMFVDKKTTLGTRIGSVIVASVVFVLIVSNASLLVDKSIQDKYSSINLINSYFTSISRQDAEASSTLASASGDPSSTPQVMSEALASEPCPAYSDEEFQAYSDSVVNYLTAHNQDYSFVARQKYAGGLGLSDYTGTAGQNEVILSSLLQEQNSSPGASGGPCKN